MLQKFWSKAQMSFFVPIGSFEDWPEGTYSFCPQCAMDSFELLFKNRTESYVRCRACGALWVINAAMGPVLCDPVTA
jgi:hypothetical protein